MKATQPQTSNISNESSVEHNPYYEDYCELCGRYCTIAALVHVAHEELTVCEHCTDILLGAH